MKDWAFTMKDTWEVHFMADRMPAAFPTLGEIESFPDVSKDVHGGCGFAFVGEHYVVKYGPGASLMEGWTTLSMRRNSTVLVPEVYAILTKKGSDHNCIIMENVKGPTLEMAWDDLSESEKDAIASQLRENLTCMRLPRYRRRFVYFLPSELKEPEICGLPNSLIMAAPEGRNGQFKTVKDLIPALIDATIPALIDPTRDREADAHIVDYLEGMATHDEHLEFTHGDLGPHNMVLRDDGKVVLINWGLAGWYPPWYEYCNAMCSALAIKNDYHAWALKFLIGHFYDLVWMSSFRDVKAGHWGR